MNHAIEMKFYDWLGNLLQESVTWDHLTARIEVPKAAAYIQVGPAIPLPSPGNE